MNLEVAQLYFPYVMPSLLLVMTKDLARPNYLINYFQYACFYLRKGWHIVKMYIRVVHIANIIPNFTRGGRGDKWTKLHIEEYI